MPSDDGRGGPDERELLRAFVDRIPSMVAYWDSAQRCRFANKAYERWFNVSPSALIGTHIRDLLGPLYQLNLPYIEGALRGESQEFEREIPDPFGGPPRHSLATYIPDMVDGVARGFFVLVTDISAMKQGELALRESEERFRLTFDEAPIGMALVTADGRFLRVNRALCEIVGYTPDELSGLTFQSITRLGQADLPRPLLETRCVRKDGAIIDVIYRGAVLHDHAGAPLYFVAQVENITQRKRLEDQLRLAEARSSGILSISADAIVSIDESQCITMFNEGAERIFGHPRADVIGASIDVLLPERFRGRHDSHVKAFAAGHESARRMGDRGAEIVGLRKNGEEFPADAAISRLEVDGAKVLTVAVRDITEQKRIESEQRFLAEIGPALAGSLDYEETLSKIAELAVHGIADLCIVELLDDDGQIRRLKVASRDPSKAWVCESLMKVSLDRRRPHLMSSALESRRPVLMQRLSAEDVAAFAQSDEHLRALRAAEIRSVVTVPLEARSGLLGAIAFVSSTTSRIYGSADVRLAEQLAQRAALSIDNARLYRAAQHATQTRDDVLGIVAHDLRNPLNNILLQATLLRPRGVDVERRARRPAEAIERAVERMNRLIEDLLDITRLEAGQLSVAPACVAPPQIIADVTDAERPLATAASLALEVDVAPELPEVWADRDRLLQVLENLIGNALKFTGPGGQITVGAAPRDGTVLFWVKDTGKGIAAEDVPHLFDRFWQARKSERRGAGLGLPIVKGVVEAHRGHIWVDSTPGKGSTFFFTVPVAPPAEVHRPLASSRS